MRIEDDLPGIRAEDAGISIPESKDLERSGIFQFVVLQGFGSVNLTGSSQPSRIQFEPVSPGYFALLGIKPELGRTFYPEDPTPGFTLDVVISDGLWKRAFGGDPKILGRSLRLDNDLYRVIGVMPAGFHDPGRTPGQRNTELWAGTGFAADPAPPPLRSTRLTLETIARLKPGLTIAAAQSHLDALVASLQKQFPDDYPVESAWRVRLVPLKESVFGNVRQSLILLLGAVGLVLLIGCVNVANLLLARGMTRQKELAVRSAVGAARSTIFGQLLTESAVLALAGGALGVGVGYGMLQGLIAVMPRDTLPWEAKLTLNIPILLFTLGVTTLAGLLAGSVPAWYASRVDPSEALKEGGRTGTSAGKHRVRRVLVVGEFTLALVLLAGAGLAIHSFWNLTKVDLGVKTDHVLTFFLPVPDARSKDPQQISAYYRDILARIDAVPGVQHATAMTGMPLYGAGFGMPFTIEGGPTYADPSLRPNTGFGMVTPDYFSTFGIHLIKGRELSDQDTVTSVKVAVVNEDFVKKWLKGRDPLRTRIAVEQLIPGVQNLGPYQEWQIVGVYHNVHSADQRDENPEMLIPFWQIPWPQAGFGVRTAEDPLGMQRSIAAAVHSVDPDIALAQPETLDQIREETMSSEKFTLILFGTFAVVALFLAGLGIYGVMAFSVAQRSHEIALRMALGASPGRVVGLVVREGVILAGIGLGLGLVGAYFVGRAMQSMLSVSYTHLDVYKRQGMSRPATRSAIRHICRNWGTCGCYDA